VTIAFTFIAISFRRIDNYDCCNPCGREMLPAGRHPRRKMDFRDHLQTTGGALKRWFIAQAQDSLAVGAMWLIGLLIIRVPWAPLWALLAVFLQFIPHLGPVLSLLGPAVAAAITGGFDRMLYVLILYAVVVMLDGFLFQPMFMKRTARVPVWASILAPLVLGFFFSFWGVLLAAPILAVVYAYRTRPRQPGQ
jgi:predicted PurR-regulated permease PerM